MIGHHDMLQKILHLREALLVQYMPGRVVEQDIAFLVTYQEAVDFHRQMVDDWKNRRRRINHARTMLRLMPGGEDLAPMDTSWMDEEVEDAPPPLPEPPRHGVWGRVYGTRVIVISEAERDV